MIDRNDKDRAFQFIAVAILLIIAYSVITNVGSIANSINSLFKTLTPVIVGIVIAYILNPLVKFIEYKIFRSYNNKPILHNLSVIIAILMFLAIIIVPLTIIVPQLINSVITFIGNLDSYTDKLDTYLDDIASKPWIKYTNINVNQIKDGIKDLFVKFTQLIGDNYKTIIETSVNFGKSALNFFMSLMLSIYMLVDRDKILKGIDGFLELCIDEEKLKQILTFWDRCNKILNKYIILDILDGIIVGVSNGIFMLIMRMPYCTLVSVIVAITNLAPTFGPLVGAIIGVVILLFISPTQALVWLIFTLILQYVDGYIIKPKMFGNQFGLPSILILLAIIIMGRLFGIIGILLAVPIAVIIDIIYREYLVEKLKDRKLSKKNHSDT